MKSKLRKFSLLTIPILGLGLFTAIKLINRPAFISSRAGNISLAEIDGATGTQITLSASGQTFQTYTNIPGVYEMKANNLGCSGQNNPYANGCEPERIEIKFPSIIPDIYGLGMQASANQVKIDDFLDTGFGHGRLINPPTNPYNEGDIGRMRTPMFVIPSQNLIITYTSQP